MKKIIIVGAGMSGLSTGIHAQRQGYRSVIFESHYVPGGMCTAWKRKAFLFEGCLHFIGLFGLSPRHQFYQLWRDLGVFPKITVHRYDLCHEFRDATGRRLRWFTDANRLEAELLALSPTDADEIRLLCRAARLGGAFMRKPGNPVQALTRILDILRLIPTLQRFGGLSLAEYARRFQDPLIQRAICSFFVYPEAPASSLFIFMGVYDSGEAGYPMGSSLALAQAVAAQYEALGGKIRYRQRVVRIMVENNRAVGVELADGTVEHADVVVSAADLHATCTTLLGDHYTPQYLRERFVSPKLFQPLIQVSLGIGMDLSSWPHSLQVAVPEAFMVAGTERQVIWLQHFAFDPATAPTGKTAVTLLFPSNHDWWSRFERTSPEYQAEKALIAKTTIEQLEKVIPGLSDHVEFVDVATPLTTIRYTGNWQGALGFMVTPATAEELMLKPHYTLEGLDGFYQAGQWVRGLGVPLAAQSGKEIVTRIRQADGRRPRGA